MQSRLFLNVVIRQRTAVLELLPSKDQALLVRRNALLVLNLRLDIVDRVRRLDLEGDGLARQGLDNCRRLLVYLKTGWRRWRLADGHVQICIPPRRRSTR